jgi:hypothetical protein
MDAVMMMKTAVVLLIIAALGGLLMLGIRLAGKDRPPTAIAMLHGLLAAAALSLLIYAAVFAGIPPLALAAIGSLVAAALVGTAINLMYHSKQLRLPITPIVIHAGFAIAGVTLLLVVLFQSYTA